LSHLKTAPQRGQRKSQSQPRHRELAPNSPGEFDELVRLGGFLSRRERRKWGRRRGAQLRDFQKRVEEAAVTGAVPGSPEVA
jgi:hypothetical protein